MIRHIYNFVKNNFLTKIRIFFNKLLILKLHLNHFVTTARLVSEDELNTQAIFRRFVTHQMTWIVLLDAHFWAVVQQHNSSRADSQQPTNVHLVEKKKELLLQQKIHQCWILIFRDLSWQIPGLLYQFFYANCIHKIQLYQWK